MQPRIRQGGSASCRLSTRNRNGGKDNFLIKLNYIPVLEKITSKNGKETETVWKGRILNVPGYYVTDASREVVEKNFTLTYLEN